MRWVTYVEPHRDKRFIETGNLKFAEFLSLVMTESYAQNRVFRSINGGLHRIRFQERGEGLKDFRPFRFNLP